MALKLIRTTLGRCGALRVYEHTIVDSSQEVQTLTTWDEPGAHVVRVTWLAKRQALVASLVNPDIAKSPSFRARPSSDPSIPFGDPLLSSRATPQQVPRRTCGARKSCRRAQRTNRATSVLAGPADKKYAVSNDSGVRQSAALPVVRRKRLARKEHGAR
jgi:hypothetical protein